MLRFLGSSRSVRSAAACWLCGAALLFSHGALSAAEPAADVADLPQPMTSFGAAVSDGYVYIYGGHKGTAHDYSTATQSDEFLRLNLKQPTRWEKLPSQSRRQGLALVAHQGRLYRIGGFEAMNKEGEKDDLRSQQDVASFDPKTKKWTPMPALPVARSSHDAVVLGDTIYVVGGWTLGGNREGQWHETALAMDLSAEKPAWKEIAKPPFRTRALAAATHDGKLWVMGGMDNQHQIKRASYSYDPATDKWTAGPELPGEGMQGFGLSAWGTEQGLYVSGTSGALFRLSDDGQQWQAVAKLDKPRFFHALRPAGPRELLAIGGGAMGTGHLETTERILLPPAGAASQE